MAYGVFDEIREISAEGLAALNDHLRYLYSQVQGNLGLKGLAGDVTGELDGKAAAEVVELQGYDVEDNAQQIVATQAEMTADAIRLKVGQIGGGNLLKNSTFLFGATRWSLQSDSGNPPAIVPQGRTGDSCVAIGGEPGARKDALQVLRGSWTHKLIVSCYLRAAAVALGSTNPLVRLYAEAVDGDGAVHYYSSGDAAGDMDWTRVSVEIDPTGWPGSRTIQTLNVYGYGRDFTGTVWFDDFMAQEADVITAWQPNSNELKTSTMSIDDDSVDIDTRDFSLALRGDDGEVELEMAADGLGWNRIVTEDITIGGKVYADPETGNIDVFQAGKTLYVGKDRQADGDVSFNNIQTALDSLGRRLKDAAIFVRVDPGTYTGNVVIKGFYGSGYVQLILAGGTNAADRAIVSGTLIVDYNSAPVFVSATTPQSADTRYMPQFIAPGGANALLLSYNPGSVHAAGVSFRASSTVAVWAERSGFLSMEQCCLENAPYGSYALYVLYADVYLWNCKGTNAGVGARLAQGAHIIRQGTVPNGAQGALVNGSGSYGGGAYHDNGTVAAAESSGAAAPPPAQATAQYPCTGSRAYRSGNGYSSWRDEANLYQGNYGYGTHWGCFLFGGAAALAGKTVVSARLYLKRTGSGGSSGAQPVKLYATTNVTAIPAAGASSPVPSLGVGGSNGMTVCSLAWNAGGWYDIPAYFAQQAIAGKALCIYTGSSSYAILYGNGSANEPVLEVTYQ